jgi:rhodanese-related sulfurtransferase
MSVLTIEPAELARLGREGELIDLIDVRTPAEFREIHAEPARSVPLDAIVPAAVMAAHSGRPDSPVYLICRSGSRSRQAAERFARDGYRNVICVHGGTLAWEQAGLPVVRGEKTISLERQVRIAAGSLVALGTALGAFVHPILLVIPAAVGAGLIFAGVTDTCGMGMLLARMPWNRLEAAKAAPCATKEADR